MELVYMCKSCKAYSTVRSRAISRYDLRDELGGEDISMQCTHCQSQQTIHVNRVMAQQGTNSGVAIILGVLVAIAMATVLLFNIGFISTATFALPLVFYFAYRQQQEQAISAFNRARL